MWRHILSPDDAVDGYPSTADELTDAGIIRYWDRLDVLYWHGSTL